MAGVKTAVMKATMTGLYHTGAHRLLAPYTQGSAVIFHAAPCPAAASEGLCPEPHPRGRAPIPRCLARPGRGGGTGYRFPRRGRAAPQGGREEALRLFHFRRRLPGQSRLRLSLVQTALLAAHHLRADRLPVRTRRALVAHRRKSSPEQRKSSFAGIASFGAFRPGRCRRRSEATIRYIGGSARLMSRRSGGSSALWPIATRSTQPRSAATW